MKGLVLAVAVSILVAGTSLEACAHALLASSSPPRGARLSRSPKRIELKFSEPLEPAFSTVVVSGPSAGAFGKPQISGNEMIVPVKQPLAAGSYSVLWRATAIDTHQTHGAFAFTIGR